LLFTNATCTATACTPARSSRGGGGRSPAAAGGLPSRALGSNSVIVVRRACLCDFVTLRAENDAHSIIHPAVLMLMLMINTRSSMISLLLNLASVVQNPVVVLCPKAQRITQCLSVKTKSAKMYIKSKTLSSTKTNQSASRHRLPRKCSPLSSLLSPPSTNIVSKGHRRTHQGSQSPQSRIIT
jgi:hypothetical protein